MNGIGIQKHIFFFNCKSIDKIEFFDSTMIFTFGLQKNKKVLLKSDNSDDTYEMIAIKKDCYQIKLILWDNCYWDK